MKLLTENEACDIAGYELVAKAVNTNCENTNLVTDGTEWDGYSPFASYADDDNYRVGVFYLVENEIAKTHELDQINWEIHHYTVDYL